MSDENAHTNRLTRRFKWVHVLRLSGVLVGFAYVIGNLVTDYHVYDFVALLWLVVVVAYALRNLRQLIRGEQELRETLAAVESRERQLLDLVGNLDVSTRQELGQWLHGPAQGRLINVSRKVLKQMHDLQTKWDDDLKKYPGMKPFRKHMLEELDDLKQSTVSLIDEYIESVLRSKSHQLFPPLLAVNLQLALEELVADRAILHLDARLASVGVTVVPPDDSPDRTLSNALEALLSKRVFVVPELRYAIYRIIEEGLVNAEKKGADRIDVFVDVQSPGIVVRVVDRGTALPEFRTTGLGSRIIETMVAKLGGRWSLVNSADGVTLTAELPDAVVQMGMSSARPYLGEIDSSQDAGL